MDNEKLIAQISSTEESWVDRVSIRRNKNSSLTSRMPQSDELRKKTIRIEGMAKSRLTKLRLQDNFENLKNNLHYEYGDNLILNLKSNEIVIYSKWIEGITLKESHLKEEALKPDDLIRIKNKLKLWVRIFEHLSFFHAHGVVHGNLKPENILIRDRATVDSKLTYDSEFFDKKDDVPHVILLDGGYNNLIEFQKENLDYELLQAKIATEKKTWLSPEAHGFLEGSYKENSDVFSLTAVMAWDFGLVDTDRYSILNSLWSIFNLAEANSYRLGNKIYKWPARNSLSDMLKRFRTILLKGLEPLPEKRTVTAREIAFEIMLMANRLSDTIDASTFEESEILTKSALPIETKKAILIKSFELPEKIISFALKEEKLDSNRLWIEARNKTANKHALMRSLNSGLNIVGLNSFYFGTKHTQSKIPFYNLNIFCNSLLSYVMLINPQFLQEIRSIFSEIGSQIESIFFVLPSLRNYAEKSVSIKPNNKNNLIQVQHESIQNNIENLVIKIINSSKINFIIIDDINRADHSSLYILLKIISNINIKIQWIIGIRADENLESEETKKLIFQMKQKDISFASLKDNRTVSYWITKLNILNKNDAKMLAMLSLNPTAIDIETIEIMSNKFSIFSKENTKDSTIFNGKLSQYSSEEDLIPYENQTENTVNKTQNYSEDKQNKDNLSFASEVIKHAIHIGLINEDRDIVSGRLISYYWEHQFILLSLSTLLAPEIKTEIYNSLFNIYHLSLKENESLSKIIHVADCLIYSNAKQSQIGAYSALLIASEELCDIYSAEYIINKLQLLEEKIELERSKEAYVLIPKIREKIADLCRSINKIDIAERYYSAVTWNISNRKRRSILMLKSFFPSQIKNKDIRTKEFYRILEVAGKSEFFPNIKNVKTAGLNSEIKDIIYKIQKKLTEKNSYLENEDNQNNKDIFKKFLATDQLNYDEYAENLNQTTNSYLHKSVRDNVLSYFFRSCIGWIDNSHIYPYIIKSLTLAAENNDGESTIHLLFSLILTCERNIPNTLRAHILETITDIASRIGNTFTLYEVLLTRSWLAIFYDGNLADCKRSLDRLNFSYDEMPFSIRQCTKKLQILCEFENAPLQNIDNHSNFIQKHLKKFQEYDLLDWSIGYEVYHLKSVTPTLKVLPGDALFLGNILNEKTDQLLLYTHYLIEAGHANAAGLVCNEAKKLNIRPWFMDPSSHLEYVPEKLAENFIEYTLTKNYDINKMDRTKYYNFKDKVLSRLNDKIIFYSQKYLGKYKSLLLFKKLRLIDIKLEENYWGEDKSILFNIKMDSVKTQDTEKLHFLAQNAFRTGFLWSAFRIAQKARCDLATILSEVKEINEVKNQTLETKEDSYNNTSNKVREENGYALYDKSVAYPEQGVAINFILEFLHNFQQQIQESKLTDIELKEVYNSIKRSIPKDTDLVESTLAGALNAYAKRMQIHFNGIDSTETEGSELTDQPNESQNNIHHLPKAG